MLSQTYPVAIQTNYMVNLPTPGAPSTTNLISALDSGKTLILLNNANAQTFTLPLTAPGLRYRIMVGGATAGAIMTITTNPIAVLYGAIYFLNAGALTATPASESTSVRFAAASALGDYVDLNCDGQFWYLSGLSRINNGLTIA